MCQGRLFWYFAGFPRPLGHGMEQDTAASDFCRTKASLLYDHTSEASLGSGSTGLTLIRPLVGVSYGQSSRQRHAQPGYEGCC